jgi:hypothetical protein
MHPNIIDVILLRVTGTSGHRYACIIVMQAETYAI